METAPRRARQEGVEGLRERISSRASLDVGGGAMAMARGAAGTEERRRRRDEESAAEDEGRTSGGGDMVAVSVLFRSGRSHSHSTVLLMPSSSISGCPAHLSRGIAIRDPRTRVHSLDRMIRVDPLHFFCFPFLALFSFLSCLLSAVALSLFLRSPN